MELNLLTNLITTSPCFFNPDTTMIRSVIRSLIPLGILKYKTYITCDGYIVKDNHQLKCGVVTKDMTEKYENYLKNLEELIKNDEEIKEFAENIKLLKLTQRFGFAYAVKNAIETEKICSKYIMLIQHDWIFTDTSLKIDDFIAKMEKSSDINYIGFVSDSTEKYLPYIKCQFTNDRKRIINDNKDVFHPEHSTLVKLNFWYDRNHLARLDYYMNYVFTLINEKDNKPVVRNFFEDTFGHHEMNQIKEKGIEAHKAFGSYLYYPIIPNTNEYSKIVVAHLNGRKYLPKEEKARLIEACKIMHVYWKEDFEIPRSFQYTFKKIVFYNLELYEKLLKYDKENTDPDKKTICNLFEFFKSVDEQFYLDISEVYAMEKENLLESKSK